MLLDGAARIEERLTSGQGVPHTWSRSFDLLQNVRPSQSVPRGADAFYRADSLRACSPSGALMVARRMISSGATPAT